MLLKNLAKHQDSTSLHGLCMACNLHLNWNDGTMMQICQVNLISVLQGQHEGR